MKLNYIFRRDGNWICVQTDGFTHKELKEFKTLSEAAGFMSLMFIESHMIEMNTTEKINLIDAMKNNEMWPPFKTENQIMLDHDGKFHLLRDGELLEIITGNIKYADICGD